jgi:hypothetical protein
VRCFSIEPAPQSMRLPLSSVICIPSGLLTFIKRYLVKENRSVLSLLLAFDVVLVSGFSPIFTGSPSRDCENGKQLMLVPSSQAEILRRVRLFRPNSLPHSQAHAQSNVRVFPFARYHSYHSIRAVKLTADHAPTWLCRLVQSTQASETPRPQYVRGRP